MVQSMIDHKVVHGHFLTRRNAAIAAGMTARKLRTLPGVIRIEGRYDAEEAYPAVQFMPEGGFVPGIRDVVAVLDGSMSSIAVTAWVGAHQPRLGGMSVVAWLASGRSLERVMEVASHAAVPAVAA